MDKRARLPDGPSFLVARCCLPRRVYHAIWPSEQSALAFFFFFFLCFFFFFLAMNSWPEVGLEVSALEVGRPSPASSQQPSTRNRKHLKTQFIGHPPFG